MSARSGRGDDLRDCLICDADDAPIGIAGVMGGATSEISPSTTRVLLEAAYFAPMAIARTSKRAGRCAPRPRPASSGAVTRGASTVPRRRLVELLALSAGPAFGPAADVVDVRGPVPAPDA